MLLKNQRNVIKNSLLTSRRSLTSHLYYYFVSEIWYILFILGRILILVPFPTFTSLLPAIASTEFPCLYIMVCYIHAKNKLRHLFHKKNRHLFELFKNFWQISEKFLKIVYAYTGTQWGKILLKNILIGKKTSGRS